jgi:DNA-directed RNA polymerase subunit RPC12/RpoP
MSKKSYLPRSVCTECGCEQLVEERLRVRRTIAAIREDGDEEDLEIVYDKRYIHAVEPEHIEYHCLECGYVVPDKEGKPLHGIDMLAYWLLDQAAARRGDLKFECPKCGGTQLEDRVEIDAEGFCERSFHCGDCGELICDEEESTLRKILEWGQKCSEKLET